MYLVYVDNKSFADVKSVAEELATDDHNVRYRNPEHFSGPNEFKRADKVFVFGGWPDVVNAAKEAEVDVEVNDVPEQEPETSDEEEDSDEQAEAPSMDWKKDELTAYAESNDIEVVSRDTKQDIMDKINEASNG